MPNAREPQQLERLAPGRDQIGEVGDIVSESPGDFISVHPGDFVGIRTNLRRIRHEKGFSQEVLAHEAGVNRTYMSKLEKGDTWAGLEIMVRLSTVLGIEPADLLQPPAKRVRKR